ncbi:MAG TPA: hypothetical protein VFD92_19960 [Candidatus Binatia bacterium]|nr:hypothetical protein [Candidatus Binatia bacterium]
MKRSSKPHRLKRRLAPHRAASAFALGLSLAVASAASAQTTYGTLSNFDVFNDTGQECHGFEIELEGISPADVTYTFGAPYERYGDPTIEPYAGGVYVRYKSPWDPVNSKFTEATPLAPAVIAPTDGHACWTGGSGNYLTSGCEHFGIGLAANPTRTTYRWLVADPAVPGALQPAGTKVSIPAPVWNVAPAPVPGPPVVQAVLPPEPAEVQSQWGDAMWVKVFKTEAANPADLDHLLTDDPAVPQEPAETEMEWKLLQARPNGAGNDELVNEAQAGNGAESVTRRYEFYEYTGVYDPETHEAMCADGSCDLPADGELGNYIGAQMAAVNLVPPAPAPVTLTVGKLGNGDGSITSAPAGIDCGASCASDFAVDSVVTLGEQPAADSFFGGWSDACSGAASSADVTMSAAATCTATFHLLSESADLDVTPKLPRSAARAGHRVRQTVIVQNLGPALASGAVLTFSFPTLSAEDAATIKSQKKCSIAGAVVTCPIGDLPAGRKVRRAVTVQPAAPGTVDVHVAATSAAPSVNPAASAEDVAIAVQ